MPKTEAWWICGCGAKLAKVKSGKFQEAHRQHLKVCKKPGRMKKQMPQGKP